MPRSAIEPLQIQAFCLPSRQGFTPAPGACESVPVMLSRSSQLDRGGTTDTLGVESGGRSFAAVNDWQTGNSGAIPGRPRRCIQANFPDWEREVGCYQAIATETVKPCGSREGMQSAELGSQKTYQHS